MNEEMISVGQEETKEDDLNDRFLTFYIEDAVYGIALSHVTEIISIQSVTHIPEVSSYVKGIINLRGKVVPVMDVRLKFGQEEIPYTDKTCIIVVSVDDVQIGLIVDGVSEVVTIYHSKMASPPSTNGMTDRYLAAVAEVDGSVILVINFSKFFQADLDGISISQ